MSETLFTVRHLKLFNRLNKCIKQGITDLQNRDFESCLSYLRLGLRTAEQLTPVAEAPLDQYFRAIAQGLRSYLEKQDESVLVSADPKSVHSQLWMLHKKLCELFDIPYVEDVDQMDSVITDLQTQGRIQ